MKVKNFSGSRRGKMTATPKQDKWKDPFYAAKRIPGGRVIRTGHGEYNMSKIHDLKKKPGFFKRMQNGFNRMMKNRARVRV